MKLTLMSLNNMSAIVFGEILYNYIKSGVSKLMRSKVFYITIRQEIISSNILRKFSKRTYFYDFDLNP